VLIGPHTKAYEVAIDDPHWFLIYQDATAALFKRTSLPTAGTIELAKPDAATAETYFP